jgi:hypothetical protein
LTLDLGDRDKLLDRDRLGLVAPAAALVVLLDMLVCAQRFC